MVSREENHGRVTCFNPSRDLSTKADLASDIHDL